MNMIEKNKNVRSAIKYAVAILFVGILIVCYSGVEYVVPYVAADALVDIAQKNPEKSTMAVAFSESLSSLGVRRSSIIFVLGGIVCLISILQIFSLARKNVE